MRRVLLLFLGLVCVISISWGYFYWPSLERRIKKLSADKTLEIKDITRVKELLHQSKPEEAFAIIEQYSDSIDNRTDIGKEWLYLLIRTSEVSLNISQLTVLYDYYPKAFDAHEKAAMLVGDAFLVEGRSRDYDALRENWKGRETKPETWFVLDADKLLIEGKRKEAIDYLNSRTFPGKADTQRLIRLGLLYIFEEPKTAWDYFAQAYNKDPENPEIRSYRAKLLETVGKNASALTEYLEATKIDSKNLYLKDQLAEFYLRQKQYTQALQVWSEILKPPSLDFVWIKTLFWNRAVIPLKFDWQEVKPPDGKSTALINYLLDMPEGQFWSASELERLPNSNQYLKTQQATFWLRLLAALKAGKEKEANDLLQYNPFQTVSWNPKLEDALKSLLLYRKTGWFIDEKAQLTLAMSPQNAVKSAKFPKDLLAQLEYLKVNPHETDSLPNDLQELLQGPDAFAAIMLSAGWFEAALQLKTFNVVPHSYPDWYAFEIAQALRQNRGDNVALEFAKRQEPTPAVSLMIGEILAANGKADKALEYLTKLTKEQDEIGSRATWLVSLIYIERGQYKDAKDTIELQSLFAKELLGQETLARIALLQGNAVLADQLYTSLEGKSSEAKSYLARKAFNEKNWKKARELTEQLLIEYPSNVLLRDNLKKIIEEQNKTKTMR